MYSLAFLKTKRGAMLCYKGKIEIPLSNKHILKGLPKDEEATLSRLREHCAPLPTLKKNSIGSGGSGAVIFASPSDH